MVGIGQSPTGSRDPFGIRRAASGVFRVVLASGWPLSLADLVDLACGDDGLRDFLLDRFRKFLRDAGYTAHEINAVFRPNVSPAEAYGWALGDLMQRLQAIRTVRPRKDFAQLVDLTKRVDNILTKGAEQFREASSRVDEEGGYQEEAGAALSLASLLDSQASTMVRLEQQRQYVEAVDSLAQFVDPVEQFFETVLVLDPSQPAAMLHRQQLLARLREVLTRCFDIRELAGQADRSAS